MTLHRKQIKFLFILWVAWGEMLFYTSGQTVLQRSLHWNNPQPVIINDSTEYLSAFTGAVYPESDGNVPFYSEVLEGYRAGTHSVCFLKQRFEPVPAGEVPLLGTLSDSITISVQHQKSRKSAMVIISFKPFRKNPETGVAERLVSFSMALKTGTTGMIALKKEGFAWKYHSLLASGNWVKIKVDDTGIYKLTYAQLTALGIEDPATLRIFGYGSGMLPLVPGERTMDDLEEIPVRFVKGDDGVFNSGDYVLFYAQGPVSVTYNQSTAMFLHKNHHFSDFAYYFMTSGSSPEKQIEEYDPGAMTPTHQVTDFTDYAWHEEDMYNLIRSGSQWFGEKFDATTEQQFTFSFPNLVSGSKAQVYTSLAGRSGSTSSFSIIAGSSTLGILSVPAVSMTSTTGNYANLVTGKYSYTASGNTVPLTIQYNKEGQSEAAGWLDFIDVNAKRQLTMTGSEMSFRSTEDIGTGSVGEFLLSGANSLIQVWDVTDMHNVRQMEGTLNGMTYRFICSTDTIHEFIAFDQTADFPSPVTSGDDLGVVPNQDLHGIEQTDMVIITSPVFLPYAEKLASLHREVDHLNVTVTTTTQVYNEFSSGIPDVAAYRDFLKMLYDRASSSDVAPRYLLLFGDGSYDNKTSNSQNPNFILTYESSNSLTQNASYVTDDFFGLLDDGEAEASGLLDIGIGRLPVKSTEEASGVVNKIIAYMKPANTGEWTNLISFIGDDEDNSTHMYQSDMLASYVESNYPAFNIEKIYLDAYLQQSSPSGATYPDVNRAINNRVKEGALIINYIGHGNENGLAHEKILQTNDIKAWENKDRYPLFVTATCEFSRFDDVSINGSKYSDATSAGEWVLLDSVGGGVALLSTTRLVYSGPNYVLDENFYKQVFCSDTYGNRYRLGDMMRLAKISTGAGINKLNFTLLGDPAITLVYPKLRIVEDSIRGRESGIELDTLKAFDEVKVYGHIEDGEGVMQSTFNGEVVPELFDKKVLVTTLDNDGEGAFQFYTYNSILFKGRTTVDKGLFAFSFIMPKDINYLVGNGRLSFYARNDSLQAQGVDGDILVGGLSGTSVLDGDGPQIRLFMNDTLFRDGGITDENPELLACVYDEHGINTTGSGIGHDITATLDDATSYTLNDYYTANLDDYQSGKVQYPLSDLSAGIHTLKLKVWDTYNNSSEAEIRFIVAESSDIRIDKVSNYPNPFSDHTTFEFTHNQAGTELQVVLQIFSITGQLVYQYNTELTPEGYITEPLVWDGKSSKGGALAGGVYLYRIRVKNTLGQRADKTGKLIIMR